MTNFVIKEEFWNDTGDYHAYWDESNGEVTYVTGSQDVVEWYVKQLNQPLIDAALKKAADELAVESHNLDRINIQLDAAAGLAYHERNALGIDLNVIVANKEKATRQIDVLKKKIEAINTAPYEGSGWKVPVSRRYIFEEINMVKLVDNNGTVDVIKDNEN